ncbi:MAG: isoamylase [Patescibacteria group bacterium]|nr:isoamylase [Patescibacteria group bacterium]
MNIENNPNKSEEDNQFNNERVDLVEKYGPLYDTEPGHTNQMGVSIEASGCNVAVRAGTAHAVDVCIFDPNDHNKTIGRYRLKKENNEDEIFCGFIPNMKSGDVYGLRADGRWDPNNNEFYNYSKLLIDPYAKAIIGTFDASSPNVYEEVNPFRNYIDKIDEDSAPYVPRCVAVDDTDHDGTGDKPNIPISETIIYESNVKDSTYLLDSIPENIRGTYAGMASDKFIDHLKYLGVTTIELLPVQFSVSEPHLQEKGLSNHWGYNTLGFFALNANYSSSSDPNEQIKEFKSMVRELHKNNIEVILDVVYNHTAEGSEHGPTISFRGLNGHDIYHTGYDGKLINCSGCGNTIDASSDTGMHIIMDSLRYFAEEMGVDGFRFDLATVLTREKPNGLINMQSRFMRELQNDPILSKLKLIAEPWDCDSYQHGAFNKDIWNEWSDIFRDTIRKFWLKNISADSLVRSLSENGYINFITAHDGFTLNDLVSYDLKHNLENGEDNNDGSNDNHSFNFWCEGPTDDDKIDTLRKRAMRSMLLSMIVATGVPMLLRGDEIINTQNGNNNAYCQDNETSWINWNLTKDQRSFLDYTSNIIHLRKDHPALSRVSAPTEQPVLGHGTENDVAWFRDDGHQINRDDEYLKYKKVVGMYLSGIAIKSESHEPVNDDCFLFYVNGTHHDQEITLPSSRPYAGNYSPIIDTSNNEILSEDIERDIEENRFIIKALSAVIFRRRSCHLKSIA